ncbi:hypothetical protein EDM76_04885 [bacterium]|nr:MAG: hypothetical protein EDM76_04885 [bacterium]MCL4232649.1 hypothetical protein [Dehalococcoidia bacterium]
MSASAAPEAAPVLGLEALPAPAVLRDRLEALRDPGSARVVVLWVARPGNAAPAFSDPRLPWLERYPLPLIFAFEGNLAGPWLDIALACDIRVCDDESALALAGVSEGYAATRMRLLGGEGLASPVSARAALEAGLVSVVASPGGALQEARRLAGVMASRGPIALRLAKEAIWRGLRMEFEQALRFETDLTLLLQTTKDRAEGVRAFLEKRPPHFTGE